MDVLHAVQARRTLMGHCAIRVADSGHVQTAGADRYEHLGVVFDQAKAEPGVTGDRWRRSGRDRPTDPAQAPLVDVSSWCVIVTE